MTRILSTLPEVELLLATDADEAFKAVNDVQPDLILLDLRLPGLSGYEILSEFRKLEHLAEIPIFAVSANAMTHDRSQAKRAGFEKFISKPIDISCFMKIITKQLNLGA